MEYVSFGSTGLKVSRLALGTMGFGSRTWRKWALEEQESRPILRRALELGINFFDTADMYSLGMSEEILGRALKDFGPPRERVVIATKAHSPMSDDPNDRGLSRKHLFHSIDASLKRLGTDYVDLFQMHRWDPSTPIEETLVALNDIVRAGKALYVGASTMSAWQFAKLLYKADALGVTRPVSMQPYYNILYREEEREMIPLCIKENVAVIPWSPLARGFLTGQLRDVSALPPKDIRLAMPRFQGEHFERNLGLLAGLSAIAQEQRVTMAQLVLAWLLAQGGDIVPIPGTTRGDHLEENVGATEITLASDTIAKLNDLINPRTVSGARYNAATQIEIDTEEIVLPPESGSHASTV